MFGQMKKKYFDFKPNNPILINNNDTQIEFLYQLNNIPLNRFRVKPFSENGSISINSENNQHITRYTNWSESPTLLNNYLIQITGMDTSNTKIWFLIQDSKTGKVFSTPKRTIYNGDLYDKYLERINENINIRANNGKIIR